MAENERNKTKKAFSLKGYITNVNFYRLRTRYLKTVMIKRGLVNS